MWKDYLHFSQGEKRGIILLGLLIILLAMAPAIIPHIYHDEPYDFTQVKKEIDSLYFAWEKDSIGQTKVQELLPPATFRIDTVGEDWLTEHGMPQRIAKNITNYKAKGGIIQNHEKFRSIYGMNDSVFEVWKGFVIYPKPSKPTQKTFASKPENTAPKSKQPDFQIEINSADTAEFVVLYGIGSSFADRIVKYRNVLGGYVSVSQIKEVYGMDSTRFAGILPYLKLDKVEIRKIPINTASLKRMKSHPYFSFYQAKAVYEYRKAGNTIGNWEEFCTIPELDTAGMHFLPDYLDYSIEE